MALRDHVRLGRGCASFNAQEILASSEFQAMTLEERGRWFTDILAECPVSEAPDRYVPVSERRAVAERYGATLGRFTLVRCPCGATGWIKWKKLTGIRFVALHLDHVHPVSRGGKSDAANLQLLCPACNLHKGAREVA